MTDYHPMTSNSHDLRRTDSSVDDYFQEDEELEEELEEEYDSFSEDQDELGIVSESPNGLRSIATSGHHNDGSHINSGSSRHHMRYLSTSSNSTVVGSNDNEQDENRRDHHNQLERKRRASIKGSYNELKEVVPNLKGSKASRAIILQKAVECIDEYRKKNKKHSHCVELLSQQNEVLERQVLELQRNYERMENEDSLNNPALILSDHAGSPQPINSLNNHRSHSSGSSSSSSYRILPNNNTAAFGSFSDSVGGNSTRERHSSMSSNVQLTNNLSTNATLSSSLPVYRLTEIAPANTTANNDRFNGLNQLSFAAQQLQQHESLSTTASSVAQPVSTQSSRPAMGTLVATTNPQVVSSVAISNASLTSPQRLRRASLTLIENSSNSCVTTNPTVIATTCNFGTTTVIKPGIKRAIVQSVLPNADVDSSTSNAVNSGTTSANCNTTIYIKTSISQDGINGKKCKIMPATVTSTVKNSGNTHVSKNQTE